MKFGFIDAVAVVAALANAALSPAVTADPGYSAQFNSDENCQKLGSANTYADGIYYHNDPAQTNETIDHCNNG